MTRDQSGRCGGRSVGFSLLGALAGLWMGCGAGEPSAQPAPKGAPEARADLVEDQALVMLPGELGQDPGLLDEMMDMLRHKGLRIRHVYSERVGLWGTVAVAGTPAAVAQVQTAWPGVRVEPVRLRRLLGAPCGDQICGLDEKATGPLTTTCSIDCGVPKPRAEQDELENSTPAATIGASTSWGVSDGSGVTVCVIDSGYDRGPRSQHPDQPAHLMGGFDLVNQGVDFSATDGHGTHVMGLVAAPRNGYGMIGSAPGASVRMYNVFSVYGGRLGASEADILAALDMAASDGCKIINMSFGAGGASPAEGVAMRSLYERGVLLVAAAGNSEDASRGDVGTADRQYPASYREVLAVGALASPDRIADFSSTGQAVGVVAPGVGIFSTFPQGTGDREPRLVCTGTQIGEHPVAVAAPLGGSGTALPNQRVAVCGYGSVGEIAKCQPAGKLALLQRGPIDGGGRPIPFADKISAARAAGAVGILLYNHWGPDLRGAGRLLTGIDIGGSQPLPVLTLAAGDGEFLAAAQTSDAQGLRCSLAVSASQHALLDGTSMAAPLVSGAAAQIWAALPGLSNVALRQLLQETATDVGAPGRDDAFGWGLVNVEKALSVRAPRQGCGDGKLERSELCDGADLGGLAASCDALGFDGALGGSARCNAQCNGLSTDGCLCAPGRQPFDATLSLVKDYRYGSVPGTLAAVRVRLAGAAVLGAQARLELRSGGVLAKVLTLPATDAQGDTQIFLPARASAAALAVGEYEVTPKIGKGRGRCRDEQSLPPFSLQILRTQTP